jgi:DNA-binding CsgD family transcriptional regulator
MPRRRYDERIFKPCARRRISQVTLRAAQTMEIRSMMRIRHKAPTLQCDEGEVSGLQLSLLLDHIAMPVFLLTKERALLHANAAGHHHIDAAIFAQLHGGRFNLLGDMNRIVQFEDAIQHATEMGPNFAESFSTIALFDSRFGHASVTILPQEDIRHVDHTRHWLAAVIFAAHDMPEVDTILRLRQTFNFTPAEARVAYFICAGKRPKLIAGLLQVSVNTVKSHLANVFSKTGCADQATFCVLAKQLLTPVQFNHQPNSSFRNTQSLTQAGIYATAT